MKDGRFEIDNGFVERVIRSFAIVRNNWVFSDSQSVAHASALVPVVVTNYYFQEQRIVRNWVEQFKFDRTFPELDLEGKNIFYAPEPDDPVEFSGEFKGKTIGRDLYLTVFQLPSQLQESKNAKGHQ